MIEALSKEELDRIRAECTSPQCTRMLTRNGITSGCVGRHCPYCGEPVGHYGHPAEQCSARSIVFECDSCGTVTPPLEDDGTDAPRDAARDDGWLVEEGAILCGECLIAAEER